MLRRKLVFNFVILAVCGAIALTIPVIANYYKKETIAATQNHTNTTYRLTSYFVGDQNPLTDTRVAWQICLKDRNEVVMNWHEIYTSVMLNHNLTYDTEHLELTPQGLIYRGIQTDADYENLYTNGYRSTVTYKSFTCEIRLR